ncbi:MAG: DNA polymerase Y family protein [Bacteroidota bacterium]|nr:DNA polymerase Y family protein [Bacteroidota bacterium]
MGKRYVSIWFRYLATDWFSLRQPTLKEIPFVLTEMAHGRQVIKAANTLAEAKGVFTGTVLADARAVLPSLQAFDYKRGLTEQLLQRIAEWCIRFTPVAAPDEPEGVVLDATGCAHLWGSEAAYLGDISKRFNAKGYQIRIAMADSIGAAWAVARYAAVSGVVEEGKQGEALLTLPPAALRLDTATTERLHKLGLSQVKNFIAMPQTALRRRFGVTMLKRLHQALGDEEEGINPVYPLVPYQERLPCFEPILRIEGINIALQHLLAGLCQRLLKEGKGLRAAYFRCYRADGGAQGIEIGTSRPSANAEHLFRLFELKLSTLEPKGGIDLFVLEATRVEDALPLQETLWKAKSGLADPALAELVDRLANKLGADAVQRYLPAERWWPEQSVKKTSSLQELPDTAWRADSPRPLQLLSVPERIDVTAPIPDYPPMNFRYKGKLHKVVRADGPERIEQEWWVQEGEHRDYYCVEDEEGCRYWLFRLGHYTAEKKSSWYLHGFFP